MAARAGGALASRAGWLPRQPKGLRVRFRAFSMWPQKTCLNGCVMTLAARPAMILILPCQRSSLRGKS